MKNPDLSPETLLPHDHPMILIDGVLGYDEESVTVDVTPAPGKPFADEDGNVPGWVGMEYMAQAIAAYAGVRAQLNGQPVKVGFLLGTRAYDIFESHFQCHQQYAVSAKMIYDDDGVAAFQCEITNASTENILARATINTFQPDDIDQFMETGR